MRRRTAAALAAAASVCALLPAGANAIETRPADAGLSARLAALAGPRLGSASPREQAASLSLPVSGPGSLLRRGRRVFVEVDRAEAPPLTLAVLPEDLRDLADGPGVEAVTPVLTPVTRAACPSGDVVSEGDGQLLAGAARADFGVDGSGVEVGILSDSFDRDAGAPTHAADDVRANDLPGAENGCGQTAPVDLLEDFLNAGQAGDEGRGMAQIVHDLAPGAPLSFASAFKSEATFAANVEKLAAAGADVIVDDVAWFEEPFFQDGPVAVAISNVVDGGVSYLTAAGNDNLLEGGNEIASWEAPAFRDSPGCPVQLVAKTGGSADHCMDFDPAAGAGNVDDTFGITVEEDEELIVDLQWAEPWEGVSADLDAFLLDESGEPLLEGANVVGSQEDNPGTTQRPVEVFAWTNTGPETEVQLAIDRCVGIACNQKASTAAKPRLKLILLQNGGGVAATEYPQSAEGDTVGPAIYGHAGAEAATTVGAVPYFNSGVPEQYSSRGPVRHYFGPVLSPGGGPAAAIVPRLIPKPEVAATDCGRTSFFVPDGGIFSFCGTSAAAPHAAAVVALARQANPSLTPQDLEDGLRATARPLPPAFDAAVGAGLIDAHRLIEETALPPRVTITAPPAAVGRDRSPQIGFTANRPAVFRCELDGSAPFPCSSPFVPGEPLGDGPHGFVVRAIDVSGREGSSPLVGFRVDTVAPRTRIARHPRKNVRTRRGKVRAAFGFRSNEPDAQFVCRVDGGLFRFCRARISRRFGPGPHAVRVKAIDAAGNVDATPAVFRFRVRKIGR